MRRRHTYLAFAVIFASSLIGSADASGQGLLRRLRSRIAPLLAEQPETADKGDEDGTEDLKNRLPARAVPRGEEGELGSGRSPAASNSDAANRRNPASRYRTPARAGGASRIPSIAPRNSAGLTPTPAIGPGGVRQAGATADEGANANSPRGQKSGSFGKSVLSPLDFGDEQPAAASSKKSSVASIGIRGVEANPGYPAVEITGIADHSLAHRDGLRVGDFIFAIDGVPTPSVRALAVEVAKNRPGDRVRLRIGRAGQVSDLDVMLVEKPGVGSGVASPQPNTGRYLPRPAEQPSIIRQTPEPEVGRTTPDFGADVQDVRGRRGVLVTKVKSGSVAAKAGLKPDDRIVAIDRRMVSDTDSLVDLLSLKPNGSSADVQLIRNNQLVNVTFSFSNTSDGDAAKNDVSGGQDSANGESKADGNGSLAGGLGSVFGGMFGAKTGGKNQPSNQVNSNESDNVQPTDSELPAPKRDPLALDSGFGGSLPASLAPGPQPTLAAPKIEEKKSSKADEESDSEEVRAEIKRLRDQLKKLEDKLTK